MDVTFRWIFLSIICFTLCTYVHSGGSAERIHSCAHLPQCVKPCMNRKDNEVATNLESRAQVSNPQFQIQLSPIFTLYNIRKFKWNIPVCRVLLKITIARDLEIGTKRSAPQKRYYCWWCPYCFK